MMPLFIEENIKETDCNNYNYTTIYIFINIIYQAKKFKCKFDNEVLKEQNVVDHFSLKHKQEFQKWLDKEQQKNKMKFK